MIHVELGMGGQCRGETSEEEPMKNLETYVYCVLYYGMGEEERRLRRLCGSVGLQG